MRLFVLTALALAFATGCPPKDEPPAVTRGRQAYMGTCIACHNVNPALDGAIGPALAGSPKALLESKVIKGEYPAGYKSKRDTKLMPPQPALAGSIDDLAAFLNR